MAIPDKERKYSYADYLTWDEGERVELINGEVFDMSPAPSRKHQEILRELSVEFSLFLRDKNCEAFFAPFDVQLLSEGKQDDESLNVVQPDLTVVCDHNKLTEKGCSGTPDMIVEILSPASVKLDRWQKYQLYERAGVKEYWIVDATNESVEVYLLENEQYRFRGVFTSGDRITAETLPGLDIDVSQVFG